MAYDIDGVTHKVAKAPTTVTKTAVKPPPPPKIFYFQGKSYTSEAAYAAAVSAAKAAAAASAAAKQRAAAAADEIRRSAAARAANEAKMAAYRTAAAAAALKRSEELRAQALRQRQSEKLAEFERAAAARRKAANRELIAAGRPAAPRATPTPPKPIDAMAKARRAAYDNLAARSRAVLRMPGRGVAPIDRPEARSMVTPKGHQRQVLIRQAESTGDWSEVLATLQRESRRSNGRHVDTRLLQEVQAKYVAPMQQLRDEFTQLVSAMRAAEASGNEEALLALVEDPANIELYERFIAMFGDGTRPGAFTAHQQILSEISSARERAWVSQMSFTSRTSGEERAHLRGLSAQEDALRERVQRELQVRTLELPDRGPQMIDERFTDLTFTEQVLDPDTGQMKPVVRTGVDAWLAREEYRQRILTHEQQQAQRVKRQGLNRLLAGEDASLLGFDHEGRRVIQDNNVARQQKQLQAWISDGLLGTKWRLDRSGIPMRIAAAAGNPGVQEQLIREFMADAQEAYDNQNKDMRQRLHDQGQNPGGLNTGDIEYRRRRNEFLSGLALQLGKPGWDELSGLSSSPIGAVAQGGLTAMSVIPALIRDRLQRDFGDFQPHVDIGGLTPWDDASIQLGRTADPNAAAARSALSQVSPFTDIGAWASVIRDNAMWGSGNLGGLLTQAVDPLMLSGPGRFTTAGSLAIARAGGLKAALRGGARGAGELAADFARFSLPKGLRGAGRDVVKTQMAKVRLAQKLGMPAGEALNLSDDAFRELAERALADDTAELLKSDVIKDLSQASGIDKSQLLNIVQQELPAIQREFGILAEDPFKAAARIREVRRAAVQARSQAESAAQLMQAQERRAVEMQALSEVTGRPLKFTEMTPAKLRQHERLLTRYNEAAQEYLRVAERGVRAADEIESGRLADDPRRLRTAQAQLRDAVREMQQYADKWRLDKHGRKVPNGQGLVSRRFKELADFRGTGDPTAPSFVDQSLKQVAYDSRRIEGLIRQAVQKLRATPLDQRLSSEWTSRLKQLRLAQRGLAQEKAMLDGGRSLARSYLKKESRWQRVQNLITPQRIAPVARNREELARGIGQDYMSTLGNSKVRQVAELSAKQEEAWAVLRPQLDEAADLSILAGAMDDADLRLLTKALGGSPSTLDLWIALRLAAPDEAFIALRPALRRLETSLVIQARRAGFGFANKKVRDAADFLWDVVRDEPSRLGVEAAGAAAHLDLDRKVEEALVAWRKFRAQGQVRLRERRFKPPSGPVDSVFHDSDPFENLVKTRVLRAEGRSLFEYDEMRGVLRSPMLRKQAGEGILERAAARSRAEGLPMDEAIEAERAATARVEIERNVEEWFSRPDMQGLPPEARLRALEEKLMLDDLPVQVEYQLSPYQERALRRAFEEELGFSYDDKHMIARYFRGELEQLPEGARVPRDGEYMDFAEAEGINTWIVPRGHRKLAEAVPFGRGRGELDDATMKMLDEIDVDLARQSEEVVADDLPQKKPWLREENPHELSEASAERRGAPAGRRQNAAAEARRSSRRNFEAGSDAKSGVVRKANKTYGFHEKAADTVPNWKANRDLWFDARGSQFAGFPGHTPTDYRLWLWDRMNDVTTGAKFRADLKNLRGKNVVMESGIRAKILADAADWLWSDEAVARFSRPRVHFDMLSRNSTPETRKVAMIQSQLSDKAKEIRQARKLAGQQFQVFVPRKWLDDVREYIERERAKIDAYYHATGERRDLSDVLQLLDDLGKGKAEDFDVELTPKGVIAPAAELRKLDEILEFRAPVSGPRRYGGGEAGKIQPPKSAPETIGSMLERKFISGTWDGIPSQRVLDLQAEEAALRAELKAAKAARHRGLVGLSVHGDGVYIAEGTSNVTVAHEIFHQFWDDEFNAAWRAEIEDAMDLMGPELRTQLWQAIRVSSRDAFDEAEMAAEMYALWRVGESAGSDVRFGWADLRGLMSTVEDKAAFDHLGEVFASNAPRVVDSLRGQLRFPPFAANNRGRLMKWMADNGYHSPRTAEAIRAGEHVWPVADERRMWMSQWGYEAPWTDEDALRVILNDPRLHQAALRAWGFFEDDFQTVADMNALRPEQIGDALVWGKGGLSRQRTIAELRDWAIQRYGALVSPDGERLVRMPWLMKADDEYLEWTKGFFDDSFEGAQRPALLAARDKLPEVIREHLFDGDALRATGMQIDPRLVKAKELDKLRDAIVRATKRRIERMVKAGDIEPGEWLAQEQLRFAYDVTDQLLVDPVWRGILRGKPVVGALLRVWGQFWRMLVSWQPAFPIMNLMESYGFKRLYLTVYEGGLRPLSLDADGLRILPGDHQQVLRMIGAQSDSIFHLSGGEPFARAGDKFLTLNQRGGALIQGLTELPVRVSKFGEDALRADFARRVAGNTFRTARRAGMSAENAEWLAKHEAKRLIDSFFAISEGSGWLTALNELVPFFSYNFKNKTLAVRMIWNHPSTLVWGERLRREVEKANRAQWAEDHPDLPFPEGPSASWLWWKVGDDYYKIDLSSFSDWTRALASVSGENTPLGWLTEFLRVPHPSQLGALAMFTGEDTPWGNPGSIRELSFWADLFYWTKGIDYADPRKRRDFIQIMSQMLFFKKFGKIGPMEIKQATFFSLRQVDEAQARAYLEANPDLQLYWDALPASTKIKGFDPFTTTHFRQLMTAEENREYDEALSALDRLNARLDERIMRYAAEPWSDEYKAAKRDAFVLRKAFMAEHPVLTRAWGIFMSPQEFAKLNETFRVDDLADAWFNWKRPARADFDDDLAYNKALVAFNERREAFLEANPALRRRLEQGRTAVETAWREQELHWTEVLDFQARLKIRILEEEATGDPDDELIEALYTARDFASADLDADRFAVFEGPNTRRGGFFASLPGFADIQYARATPEQRKQMDRDDWYFRTLKDISKKATSGKHWYEMAQANPAFMQEYWKRNPDKKAEYDANQEYIRWIGSWARKLKGDDFTGAQAVWDQMPAWVKERYFAKHPDSKMRDGAGGGSTAVQYNGKWFKSPESRDRYIAFIENGGSAGSFPEGFASQPTSFSSPEARQRSLDGQAYYATIGGWVELLKAKDYVAADRYFRAMPAWMQEKYYAKHPDQRAKNELDSEALRHGAEYFLAQGDDKLAILAKYPQLRQWLADNGGEEGAMRGLVQAMYRAIPSSEPWLKRTFREKFPEIFGQEAAGERRLEAVARDLAEHPEMLPFFERALKLQSSLFMEQLKRSKTAPKPWTIERKRRVHQKGKRRAARMSSHWSLHNDLRRGR